MNFKIGIFILGVLQVIRADNGPNNNNALVNSPYLELVLCSIRSEFWECAKRQTRRLLDTWNNDVYLEWQKIKVEGDNELKRKLESRQLSDIENIKEKPSTILSKIEIGTNYIQNFVRTTLNRLYGNEDEGRSSDIQTEEKNLTDTNENNKDNRQMRKKVHHGITHVDVSHLLDLLSGHGHKHGIKFPHKYGRSIGVQRGKKKKKKQLLMKLMLIATLIKGKIELLLKIFSAHLQVKFFLVALAGLIINIARFWIDFRRGVQPQKVIYYEHSHHQHHYDDHGGDWGGGDETGGGGGGGYWKRSLQSNEDETYQHHSSAVDNYGGADSYGNDELYANRMAYNRQIPRI